MLLWVELLHTLVWLSCIKAQLDGGGSQGSWDFLIYAFQFALTRNDVRVGVKPKGGGKWFWVT